MRLTVRILLPRSYFDSVRVRLARRLATPALASAFLSEAGVTVTTTPTVSTEMVAMWLPGWAPAPAPPPLSPRLGGASIEERASALAVGDDSAAAASALVPASLVAALLLALAIYCKACRGRGSHASCEAPFLPSRRKRHQQLRQSGAQSVSGVPMISLERSNTLDSFPALSHPPPCSWGPTSTPRMAAGEGGGALAGPAPSHHQPASSLPYRVFRLATRGRPKIGSSSASSGGSSCRRNPGGGGGGGARVVQITQHHLGSEQHDRAQQRQRPIPIASGRRRGGW